MKDVINQTVPVLPDGNLASGSWDKTVRVWDHEDTCMPAHILSHIRGQQTDCVTRWKFGSSG
jgi:WD40 repeat protein